MEHILTHLPKGNRRVLTGQVRSNKMAKTIVVVIQRRAKHPLYKKYVTFTKSIKADDRQNQAQIGDIVQVIESRPVSKEKRWRLHAIVERAR